MYPQGISANEGIYAIQRGLLQGQFAVKESLLQYTNLLLHLFQGEKINTKATSQNS